MDKSHLALSKYELFVRQLLIAYKEEPCLWKKDHPNYRNAEARNKAYEVLVKKSLQFNEDADIDFVRIKLDSLRTTFRKEFRKVIQSRNNQDEIYKPNLWYYDLLLFTIGEEIDDENLDDNHKIEQKEKIKLNPKEVRIPFWGRDYAALLIQLYKKHPCLYLITHPYYKNNKKRTEAITNIIKKLTQFTGKNFQAFDVKKKISLIRGQFLYEYKKKKTKPNYQPTLWCYKMLGFLEKAYTTQQAKSRKIMKRSYQKTNNYEESSEDIMLESNSSILLGTSQDENNSIDSRPSDDRREDIYDTIARNLVYQLNDMTNHQRIITNKIIKEILFCGKIEQLTEKSQVLLNKT